jgi:uncharacterized protein (DUF2235 family)
MILSMAPPIGEPLSYAGRSSDNPTRKKQRLILCFDGTWNKRDSGTSVYHLSNVIYEGDLVDGNGIQWTQKIKYDEGVGTGLLDSVSGGAFGSGLSINVREGYDWFVENYHGADDPKDADEIYIFGFSRGAFTARSLVGLIGKCGLVCRGAPISLEQLWEGYQILGRYPSARIGGVPEKNLWERIWGLPKKPFRELWEVKRERWESGSPPPDKPKNRSEELLCKWSRRVPITCLGVFDTVASMGLDALAVPGLQTRMARFHDTALSSIIVNGFQALAIDEHRANFVHILWHGEAGNGTASPETPLGGRIEQRWFAGAHSNIGGGYENDVLAQFPLDWMITECENLRLVFRGDRQNIKRPQIAELKPLLSRRPSQRPDIENDTPHVRDSFAEFAGILWQHILRVKREYRQIAPPPELHHGKPMRSVNETVDDSVFDLVDSTREEPLPYRPVNLWEYNTRRPKPHPGLEKPGHQYVIGFRDWFLLLIWVIVIGFGGYALGEMIDQVALSNHGNGPLSWLWFLGSAVGQVIHQLAEGNPGNGPLSWSLGFTLPLFAVFVDWKESSLNHQVALEPNGPRAERRMAWREVCLYLRLIAIVLFVLGAGTICILAWRCPWLWRVPSWEEGGWLLALDALLLCCGAAKSWCAAPMNDAGLGSIVKLQLQARSEKVLNYLVNCARGQRNPVGRDLLTPVARTIWRDILGFIPTYNMLIFAGSWLALSLFQPNIVKLLVSLNVCLPAGYFMCQSQPDSGKLLGLLSTGWPVVVAATLTVACAIADWIEDAIHLQYLKKFPKPPRQILVSAAIGMTVIKFVLFSTGILATVVVTIYLAFIAILASGLALFPVEVPRQLAITPENVEAASGLALFSAVLAFLLLLSALLEFRSSSGKKETR